MNDVDLFPFFMIPLLLIIILELIFSLAWVPFYFRNGIPLVRKSYRIPLMFELSPHVGALEKALKRSFFRPEVKIKSFSSSEFGFRNAFTSRSQVNGLIRVEQNNGRLTITGYLSWAFIMLILFGALTSIFFAQPWTFLGFLFIAGLGAFFQWLVTNSVQTILYKTLQTEGLILDDSFEIS